MNELEFAFILSLVLGVFGVYFLLSGIAIWFATRKRE
jgi:hypothetical protein